MNIVVEETFPEQPEQFWNGLSIWHDNPHLLNKRIAGQTILFSGKVADEISFEVLLHEIQSFISVNNTKNISKETLLNFPKNIIFPFEKNIFDLKNDDNYCTLRQLLYKKSDVLPEIELCYIDKKSLVITFSNLQSKLTYSLKLNDGYIILHSSCLQPETEAWLTNKFFPKIIKWMLNKNNQGENIKSHSLLTEDKYVSLYQNLKKTYGKQIIEIWPETTDPYKFVYEDIAIACYLLLLWQKYEPNKKQTFVDLGCGNGLLVYILIKEGHNGFGIDVRKRKIWDLYPENVILKENVITPSDNCLFPDVDWIIGNHSDELSPWIPIIAARSSFHCKYFLLPCCAYKFDGTKFQRKDSTLSQYRAFLDYVKQVSEVCGFETLIDRLKIPSTKRVCLIGVKRNYENKDYDKINEKIHHLIDGKNSEKQLKNDSKELWINEFKAREKEERVKNCTKINSSTINEIVELVINELLKKKNYIKISNDDRQWNCGSKISLNEIAQLIPKTKLGELKNEFGGLKTLLRNNHQIFKVINGYIQIKIPESSDKTKNINWKKKKCWFYNNHPDRCPLRDEECKFDHLSTLMK